MAQEQATLIVLSDEEAAQAVVTMLRTYGVVAQASGRRNLDGAAMTSWLVVAGLAVKTAPDILRALADLVKAFRLGHVTVDMKEHKLELDNPGSDEIQDLVRLLRDDPSDDDA